MQPYLFLYGRHNAYVITLSIFLVTGCVRRYNSQNLRKDTERRRNKKSIKNNLEILQFDLE